MLLPTRISAADLTRRRWELLALTSVGAFMAPFDGTVVSVALPAMGPSLHLGFTAVMWVQAAYLLAVAVLLIPLGRLAEQAYPLRPLLALVRYGQGFGFGVLTTRKRTVVVLSLRMACVWPSALGTSVCGAAFTVSPSISMVGAPSST